MPRVLVVDDAPNVRETFQQFGTSALEILVADSGETALQILAKDDSIDVIFMDGLEQDFPPNHITGIQTIQEIRKTNRRVLIFVISTFPEVQAQGEKVGADGCIFKIKVSRFLALLQGR